MKFLKATIRLNSTWNATKGYIVFFKDSDRIESYILSRAADKKKATYNGLYYVPSFSYGDLTIKTNRRNRR